MLNRKNWGLILMSLVAFALGLLLIISQVARQLPLGLLIGGIVIIALVATLWTSYIIWRYRQLLRRLLLSAQKSPLPETKMPWGEAAFNYWQAKLRAQQEAVQHALQKHLTYPPQQLSHRIFLSVYLTVFCAFSAAAGIALIILARIGTIEGALGWTVGGAIIAFIAIAAVFFQKRWRSLRPVSLDWVAAFNEVAAALTPNALTAKLVTALPSAAPQLLPFFIPHGYNARRSRAPVSFVEGELISELTWVEFAKVPAQLWTLDEVALKSGEGAFWGAHPPRTLYLEVAAAALTGSYQVAYPLPVNKKALEAPDELFESTAPLSSLAAQQLKMLAALNNSVEVVVTPGHLVMALNVEPEVFSQRFTTSWLTTDISRVAAASFINEMALVLSALSHLKLLINALSVAV